MQQLRIEERFVELIIKGIKIYEYRKMSSIIDFDGKLELASVRNKSSCLKCPLCLNGAKCLDTFKPEKIFGIIDVEINKIINKDIDFLNNHPKDIDPDTLAFVVDNYDRKFNFYEFYISKFTGENDE